VIDQGLFPDSVPGKKKAFLGFVPKGEGEHSSQAREALIPHFFIESQNDFGIAVGLKWKALGLKLFFELLKIINLAVKDNPKRFVVVGERLMPGFKIDDRQAPHRQAQAAFQVKALVVRTAMRD
jgi:hypothetical protein